MLRSPEKSETAPSTQPHTPIRNPFSPSASHLRRFVPAIPPPASPDRPPSCRGKSRLVSARAAQFSSESLGFRGRAAMVLIGWLLVSCAIRRWIVDFRVTVWAVVAIRRWNFGGSHRAIESWMDFGDASAFVREKLTSRSWYSCFE
jgi:hypothetical protein